MDKNNKSKVLEGLLKENKLSLDSFLYRYTKKHHLKFSDDGKVYISAKSKPEEVIIDEYDGNGHTIIAKNVGQGLAFTTQIERDYNIEDRICIRVKLGDVLDQAGILYKVTSVPEYITSFLLTLPTGKVNVEIVAN